MPIPKIIHQIWIQGINDMPENLKEEMQICQQVNHDFRHRLWSEKDILPLLRDVNPLYEDMYLSYERYAQKADLARYVILYIYGGIYLDADMVCHKSLRDFTHLDFFLTAPILSKHIKSMQNCVIGSTPYHPFMKLVLSECVKRRYSKDIMSSTGPKMIYEAIQIYGKPITIIDRKYLYPCQPFDADACVYDPENGYVAHMANASWHSKRTQVIHNNFRNHKLVLATASVGILWVLALIS